MVGRLIIGQGFSTLTVWLQPGRAQYQPRIWKRVRGVMSRAVVVLGSGKSVGWEGQVPSAEHSHCDEKLPAPAASRAAEG